MSSSRKSHLFESLDLSNLWEEKPVGILHALLGQKKSTNTLSKQILDALKVSNPIVNPNAFSSGRNEMRWQELHPSYQDAIALTTTLDCEYSANFVVHEKKLLHELNQANLLPQFIRLMEELKNRGEIMHIKNELLTSNYHRFYHVLDSAEVAAGIMENAIDKCWISNIFYFHDIVQRDIRTPILNEIESSNIFLTELAALFSELTDLIDADNKNLMTAVKDFIQYLPYIAFKTIVSATAMIKDCDGQPTIFATAKTIIEVELRSSKKLQPQLDKIVTTQLDKISLVLSLVDSNMPTLKLADIVKVPLAVDFFRNEQDLYPSSISEALEVLFRSYEVSLDNITQLNQVGLLFGQNTRMFPELAEAYKEFNPALIQAQFCFKDKTGSFLALNGVSAWNMATEAARVNDTDTLTALINAKIIKDFQLRDGTKFLKKQATLIDIFINRLDGEINFANQQGPEYYSLLAINYGMQMSISTQIWKIHASKLKIMRTKYLTKFSEADKLNFGKAIFFLASHQPAVFLEHSGRIVRLKAEEALLQTQLDHLKTQQSIVAQSKKTTSHSNTIKILSKLVQDTSSSVVKEYNLEMQKIKKQLNNIQKACLELTKLCTPKKKPIVETKPETHSPKRSPRTKNRVYG